MEEIYLKRVSITVLAILGTPAVQQGELLLHPSATQGLVIRKKLKEAK